MQKYFLTFAVLFVLTATASSAEYTSEKQIAEDKELFRDYQIQGEYVRVPTDTNDGFQIIAEGKGKFRFVYYKNGFPGEGGTDREETGIMTVNSENESVLTTHGEETVKCKIIKIGETLQWDESAMPGFKKVHHKSPTLGLAAPEGAIVLFADGKASDWFTKANVNEENKTLWSEAETKPFEKRSYTLHIEFMLSYMPEARGQGRSNSGVYIDERYECQILDSFGLKGKNNECGGFYQQAEPKVNMCYPPLTWQTYDIDFVPAQFDAEKKKTGNAKITVKHNGVLVHDKVELQHETPGRAKEGTEPLGLYLQGHGNKVQYRNIWLKYAE